MQFFGASSVERRHRPEATSRRLKTLVPAILCIALLVSGCQTTGYGVGSSVPMTPEEKRLRQQSEDFNRTIVEGAVIGGILGAVVGAMTGRSSEERAKRALIGGGIGAAMGAAGGYYVAKQKDHYASEQARLDSMIADVRADNTRTQAYVSTARKVIEENKRQLAAISEKLKARKITLAEANFRYARIEDNHKVIATTIEGLKRRHMEYLNAAQKTRRTQPHLNTAKLDGEILQLENQISALESGLGELVEAMNVSRIG